MSIYLHKLTYEHKYKHMYTHREIVLKQILTKFCSLVSLLIYVRVCLVGKDW